MTRVVAGAARGRRLEVPERGTRPTSDRVREALFSALAHRLGGFAGRTVVDLYAGSGALGLEALSRGAAHAVLVERDRRAADVLRRNVASVGLPGAHVVVDDVMRWVASDRSTRSVDLVLADPPYDLPDADVEALLSALAQHGRLADEALVVVERAAGGAGFTWPEGYDPLPDRDYGGTLLRWALWYGHDRAESGLPGLLRPGDPRTP